MNESGKTEQWPEPATVTGERARGRQVEPLSLRTVIMRTAIKIIAKLLPLRLVDAWTRLRSPDEGRLLMATIGLGMIIGAIVGFLVSVLTVSLNTN